MRPLAFSPHGLLYLEPESEGLESPVAAEIAARVERAFISEPGAGLFHLGAVETTSTLPPTHAFFRESGRCLDNPNGSTVDGTKLQIWDCNGGAAQQFTLPDQSACRARSGSLRLIDEHPVHAQRLDRLPELLELDWFDDVAVRAEPIRLGKIAILFRRGEDDDGNIPRPLVRLDDFRRSRTSRR